VICTDVGDARVVMQGIQGCHIVKDDPESIAKALRAVLSSPRRVESRERMHAYSLDIAAQKVIALYDQVIERRKGRAR
jgi:glycosyltransferase involved in cell wall biosynthesis